ncbi:MAG: hypothetical protein LBK41_06300 [Clostridiales bacterium]|jgi:hypothetical protein|nr:hypothetical protein [Clostridiales bacterium]
MASDFKPASGRITLTSVIGRGVVNEVSYTESGEMTVDVDVAHCEIGLYNISVLKKCAAVAEYNQFTGKTAGEKILSDGDCCKIMALPVVSVTEDGTRAPRWLRESTGTLRHHPLDGLVDPAPLIKRAAVEAEGEVKDEIDRLTEDVRLRKIALTRDIERLRRDIKQAEIDKNSCIADKIDAEKRRAARGKTERTVCFP